MASLRVILCRAMTRRSITVLLKKSKSTTSGPPAPKSSFRNGPPELVPFERPFSEQKQNVIFIGGIVSLVVGCWFAWYTDLFKPKLGDYDWEEIRRLRNEEQEEEEEEEDDDEEEEEKVEGDEEAEEVESGEVEAEEVEDEEVDELIFREDPVKEVDVGNVTAAGVVIVGVMKAVQAVTEIIGNVAPIVEEGAEVVEEVSKAAGEVIPVLEPLAEVVEEVAEIVEEIAQEAEHIAPIAADVAEKVEEIAEDILGGSGIPASVQYVLIGAGTASVSAMRAILKDEPDAQILMIGDEEYPPYMRPPLSKELWFTGKEAATKLSFKDWAGEERSVFYPDKLVPVSQLAPGTPALLHSTRVIKLDPTNQIVTLQGGAEIKYKKCLLAPGGQPRNLPALTPSPSSPCLEEKVHLFRNISQYQQLSKELGPGKKVLVVGGGFLGSELAYAMTQTGSEVYQSYPEAGNMGKVLPRYLSNWTSQQLEKAKIQLRTETKVTGTTCNSDNSVDVTLSTGEVLTVDHIVVAVGLEPSTDLGDTAGLEVNEQMGGYVVNAELEARSNLYVAGDAACFYDPVLGRRRVEHHDHAVVSGKLAGENMVGGKKPYHHQSMFWSDLGPSIGYEAIGLVDSLLPTVAIWAHRDSSIESQISPTETEEFEQGIVFYMQEDKIVGVVTWNIFGKMGIARKVIGEAAERTDFGKLAKQFDIHAKEIEST